MLGGVEVLVEGVGRVDGLVLFGGIFALRMLEKYTIKIETQRTYSVFEDNLFASRVFYSSVSPSRLPESSPC
jgi:hypothetical protein